MASVTLLSSSRATIEIVAVCFKIALCSLLFGVVLLRYLRDASVCYCDSFCVLLNGSLADARTRIVLRLGAFIGFRRLHPFSFAHGPDITCLNSVTVDHRSPGGLVFVCVIIILMLCAHIVVVVFFCCQLGSRWFSFVDSQHENGQ